MLEICVPWLEVIGYVWFNVSSNWLQVVCGRVLFGECDYVFFNRIKQYIP